MSVERVFMWRCNTCGDHTTKKGYGLPSSWSWYGNTVLEPQVRHRCEVCTKHEDDKKKAKEKRRR